MRNRAVPKLRVVAGSDPEPAKPPARLGLPSAGPQGRTRPAPTLDDSEIVAAARAGDEGAAASIHDRLRPRVEATIHRIVGRRDRDAEDLVQVAMLEIVTSIGRFRGQCALDSWASSVAAHSTYKHLRRRRLERRTFSGEDEPEAVAPSGERSHEARELVSRVRRHLDAMDEGKAWTFVLHDVCGFELHEIAEITGVSVAAAQSRLVRGRREIHERIAADVPLADAFDHRAENDE